MLISIDKLEINKYYVQPVSLKYIEELQESIQKVGIITPLVVEKQGNKYLIVDGIIRYNLAKKLGIKELECKVL